ncbi:MAG: FAD-dependent oxidoreductase [Burkholderiales bacterium]|nr:FAD-dependent oxidoreductase [Burkholderiales bacterium]
MKTSAFQDVQFTNGYEFTQGTGYTLPEYPFATPPELAQNKTLRHAVVIVGGGITGLTLACALANLGIKAVLLDEDNTVGVKGASSRGICYTQKSLEIFHKLGIFDRIAKKGIQWSVGRTFAGNDEVYNFDLKQQSNFSLSEQPAFINIQQFYIEGYLVERIQELGHVDLRWQSRVKAFKQNTNFATLTVETPEGTYDLQADHVIDASGSHTPFHAWTGVSMESKKGDDRWCIADVKFDTRPPTERHTWIEAPFNENRAVWQHLMADDVWRIDYQMEPNADAAYISREDVVRERLERQFGKDVKVDIVWVGPYAYKSQCLNILRMGRVFFIGDTAKIVNPFGARGGNTGVADADNLAWKLAAVLRGHADEALLESYNDERHEAAKENVKVTRRTARFLRPADGIERAFRKAAISLAKQYPFARSLVNTGRMAVANTYRGSRICGDSGGTSVQNVRFHWRQGKPGCLNDLIQWADGRLLIFVFGPQPKAALKRLQELSVSGLPVRCVQVLAKGQAAQAREHLIDTQHHLQNACGKVPAGGWALIRPDGYLANTGKGVNGELIGDVATSLGL